MTTQDALDWAVVVAVSVGTVEVAVLIAVLVVCLWKLCRV